VPFAGAAASGSPVVCGGWTARGGPSAGQHVFAVVMVASLVCVDAEGAAAVDRTAKGEGDRGADTDAGDGEPGSEEVVVAPVARKGGRAHMEHHTAALLPVMAASTAVATSMTDDDSWGLLGAVACILVAASALCPLPTCPR